MKIKAVNPAMMNVIVVESTKAVNKNEIHSERMAPTAMSVTPPRTPPITNSTTIRRGVFS